MSLCFVARLSAVARRRFLVPVREDLAGLLLAGLAFAFFFGVPTGTSESCLSSRFAGFRFTAPVALAITFTPGPARRRRDGTPRVSRHYYRRA
jgi:hypothetical protein